MTDFSEECRKCRRQSINFILCSSFLETGKNGNYYLCDKNFSSPPSIRTDKAAYSSLCQQLGSSVVDIHKALGQVRKIRLVPNFLLEAMFERVWWRLLANWNPISKLLDCFFFLINEQSWNHTYVYSTYIHLYLCLSVLKSNEISISKVLVYHAHCNDDSMLSPSRLMITNEIQKVTHNNSVLLNYVSTTHDNCQIGILEFSKVGSTWCI